ncbi:hypothetical protein A3Q56_01587 [Intoshia linei]|uniref:WD repeat domain phosphoinositide-interacting protein 2 n=1 Tax=Intoshia linei TaxID=1819745 RepID=A0A177BAT9_9BILA|nr:hypothetical protein A3Q56_01587 [Intoshia linei]
MNNIDRPTKTCLNSLTWNQNYTCFTVATDRGFMVYNVDPIDNGRYHSFNSGIKIACMLYRCNYVALVGTSDNVNNELNCYKVSMYDDNIKRFALELSFNDVIIDIKLTRKCIIVVLEFKIKIFTLNLNPVLIKEISTCRNFRGVCDVQTHGKINMLASLSDIDTKLFITDLEEVNENPKEIVAHDHSISFVTLNNTCSFIATSSIIGTIIRIFCIEDGSLIYEFRRGNKKATIFAINFSPNSEYLCLCSNRNTIHIFHLKESNLLRKSAKLKYPKSFTKIKMLTDLSFMGAVGTPSVDGNLPVTVLSMDGFYHRYNIKLSSCIVTREAVRDILL